MLMLCRNNVEELQFLSILLTIVLFRSTFSFCVYVTLKVIYFFLGASIVNNLKRASDLLLLLPDRASACTSSHPWHQNDAIVINLT